MFHTNSNQVSRVAHASSLQLSQLTWYYLVGWMGQWDITQTNEKKKKKHFLIPTNTMKFLQQVQIQQYLCELNLTYT
jgi:hypothetical protein